MSKAPGSAKQKRRAKLDRPPREPEKMADDDRGALLDAGKRGAMEKNASSMNLLIHVADEKMPNPAKEPDSRLSVLLHHLADEPEYEDPEEDGGEAPENPGGVLETLHAVAEC